MIKSYHTVHKAAPDWCHGFYKKSRLSVTSADEQIHISVEKEMIAATYA